MGWLHDLADKERRVYSQAGQDGIIEQVFAHIGTENDPPFCVEFGFNSTTLQGGSGANVANLVLHGGWRCLLLDGGHENRDINLHCQHLTSQNICAILRQHGCPQRPDYVSIDVDSTDLWLMDAMLHEYRPRLLSVEYNSNFPIECAVTHPDAPSLFRGGLATYGASLRSLYVVGKRHGYSLVHVVRHLDAFFVRDDLLLGDEAPGLDAFSQFAGLPLHNRITDNSYREFLDYDEFLATGGDVDQAKAKASGPTRRFLS